MEQRLEGRITEIVVRSCSTERYDRYRNLIALGESGLITYVTIETSEGQMVVSYSGSQPITSEIKGHNVLVSIEEVLTAIKIRRDSRTTIESDCPPPVPTRTRIYDVDAQKWYF